MNNFAGLLIARIVDAGLISRSNAERAVADLEARLAGGGKDEISAEMANGRTLELTVQPMESGGMVLLVEDITERRATEARINHLARFDALTGLPNRTILRSRMDEALALCGSDAMCAVHFIDLDQFKQVNDTLGHTRGDLLLVAVADRLVVLNFGKKIMEGEPRTVMASDQVREIYMGMAA